MNTVPLMLGQSNSTITIMLHLAFGGFASTYEAPVECTCTGSCKTLAT